MRAGGRPHRWPSPNTCCVNSQWEGVSSAYLAGPSGKTTPMLHCVARAHSCAHTHSEAPPFCAWASDVMPRLCPLCAHRKHSAVPGIRRADFPIPYPGLRCSTNLSASIFTRQSCGSPPLSHTLPPRCQPFPWRQGGHG